MCLRHLIVLRLSHYQRLLADNMQTALETEHYQVSVCVRLGRDYEHIAGHGGEHVIRALEQRHPREQCTDLGSPLSIGIGGSYKRRNAA